MSSFCRDDDQEEGCKQPHGRKAGRGGGTLITALNVTSSVNKQPSVMLYPVKKTQAVTKARLHTNTETKGGNNELNSHMALSRSPIKSKH